MADCDINKK